MWNCIVDENGSLMEVDGLNTAALDRKCNKSLFVDNHSFSVKHWGEFEKPTKIWVFYWVFLIKPKNPTQPTRKLGFFHPWKL